MLTPGDRKKTNCRGCHADIVMIYSAGGKWIPCERLPSKVDGVKMLVFANGVVGRRYLDFDGGHESHFAHCKDADRFRKPKREPPQGTLFDD